MGFIHKKNLQYPKEQLSNEIRPTKAEYLWFALDPDTLYIEECNSASIRFLNKTHFKDIIGLSLFQIIAHPLDAIKIKKASVNADTQCNTVPTSFECEIISGNGIVQIAKGYFSLEKNKKISSFTSDYSIR